MLGAGEPRNLDMPGRELSGIHFAMDYLTKSNKTIAGIIGSEQQISAMNKTVLVIGGGDTGSDCVGTANRQGAKKVYQFEILPKPPEWESDSNPEWPYWPQILRTSSSHQEGCERDWNILTKSFTGRDGDVTKVNCVRVAWGQPENGKGPSMTEIPGSEFSLDVDLVLLAMGFLHVQHNRLLDDFKVAYDARGNIKTENYTTSVGGVFAAGDADIGASLVVRAIFHGREAARVIEGYLRK